MLPGGGAEIAVMVDDGGIVVASVEGTVRCLNEHWQRVFSKCEANDAHGYRDLDHPIVLAKVDRQLLVDVVPKTYLSRGRVTF